MGVLELFLIGIGLSMDAFAVAVCKGLCMKTVNLKHTAAIALFFGAFQALMPFLGWWLGSQFARYIVAVDHWVAFLLLGFIGGKMVKESFGGAGETACDAEQRLDYRELLILAVATSIDALAVGITFAFLDVSIGMAVSIIGLTTFVLSFAGVFVGNVFGTRYKQRAELAGGVILILIGVKILLEHLGLI